MFKPGRLFLIFTFVTLSLFTLAGCRSGVSEEIPSAPTQIQPQAPPAPVLGDGSRTSYADIVDRVAPAVVMVNVEQKAKPQQQRGVPFFDNPFGDLMPQQPQQPQRPQRGIGSGVIVSADGTILTNNHVIEGSDRIRIELNDNRTFDAKIVGTDPLSDLAVVKIDAQNLPFLNLGDSDKMRVGDIILAIGNPLGIGQTVTAGIISAKGRRTGISDGSFEDFLQIDAPINRGNSGGALVNLNGELIGINSQILSAPGSGGNIGIGFSIPSNMAKSVMEQLVKEGKVRRGMLGVNIKNPDEEMRQALGLKDNKGVLVDNVKPGSAADKAGIKRADVVIAINGEKVEDSNVLRNRIAGTAPGTEITLTVVRDGSEQQVKVTLDELKSEDVSSNSPPEENGKETEKSEEGGKLGLDLQPLTPEIARRLRIPDTRGMLITGVEPSGAAAEKGVQRGDVLLEVNRQEVETFEDVKSALEKSGDRPILLLISRGGQTSYITIQPNR
ncbi:MAG TPA: DegQ family serine endoprotease [Pyrinomonadaceae bacterium]|nr:DegQ family serine endoprotease [Pyrinomonadaceae bacterium]